MIKKTLLPLILLAMLWALPCKAQSFALIAAKESAAVPGDASKLTQIDLRPYFTGDKYHSMLFTCEKGDEDECREAVKKALATEKDPDMRRRLSFRSALSSEREGESNKAEKIWREILAAYPLLSDTISYWLGEDMIKLLKWEEALAYFESVPQSSRLYKQALFRQGHCLTRLRKKDEAIALLEKLVSDYPGYFRTSEAIFNLAELYSSTQMPKTRRLWKQLVADWPGSGYDQLAAQRLSKLPKKLWSDAERVRAATSRAKILIDRSHPRKAQRELEEVDDLLGDSKSVLKGEYDFTYATALFARRRYTEALKYLKQIKETKVDNDIKGHAVLLRSRAWLRRGDTDRSISIIKTFFPKYKNTSMACEARYLWATACKLSDNNAINEQALVQYRHVVEDYPECDRVDESMHFAAWMSYRNGETKKARTLFQGLARMQDSRFERQVGQYWLARIDELEGREYDAVERYTILVKNYPLGYYSQMAMGRLMQRGKPLPSPAWPKMNLSTMPVNLDLRMDLTFLYNEPSFAKALELWRLGLEREASKEISYLQEKLGNNQVDWMFAWLYHIVGDHFRSHWIGRVKCAKDLYDYPVPGNRSYWMLAYPRPYKDLVEKYAGENKIDPFFVWAIMREESAFKPEVHSPAKAVGLTQMIYPTGKHVAKKLGHNNFKLEDLEDPETSIRFGAYHLRELLDFYKGNMSLAISAYNAGSTAVGRWLREKPDMRMDEFNEDIPYGQTRRYTRRVFSSYGIYRYLYSAKDLGLDLWDYPKSKTGKPAK